MTRWLILIQGIIVIGVVSWYFWQPKPIVSSVLSASTSQSKCHARLVNSNDSQAWLPDVTCTPGTVDMTVTQENISQTICKSGYTKTVRPAVGITNKLKSEQIYDYGYTDTSMQDYEEDHLISLELGGSPADPKNLWPEPHASFNEKDKVENYLHEQVCLGKITLADAQMRISTNWYQVYLQIQ